MQLYLRKAGRKLISYPPVTAIGTLGHHTNEGGDICPIATSALSPTSNVMTMTFIIGLHAGLVENAAAFMQSHDAYSRPHD